MSRINQQCPSCGAYLEDWGTHLRCPWSLIRADAMTGRSEIIACGRPYRERRTEIAAPITGRTKR